MLKNLCKKIINVIKKNVGKMWKTRRYKRTLKKKTFCTKFIVDQYVKNM